MFVIKKINEPIFVNSFIILVNSIIGSVLSLLFWVVAAHITSAYIIGLSTAVISLASLILNISRFGMDLGFIRFYPLSNNKSKLYSNNILVTLFISVFLSFIFIIFIQFFSPSLVFLQKPIFLITFILYIILNSIYLSQNTAMIAKRIPYVAVIQNVIFGIRIPILIIIISLGTLGIISSIDIGYLLTIIISSYILSRNDLNLLLSFDFKEFMNIIKFSLGNYLASLLSIAPISIVPLIVINMLGAEKNAYFYMAYSIASILFIIPSSISMSLLVEGSHNINLKKNIMNLILINFLLMAISIIVVFIFGDKILLLFSKEYSDQAFTLLKLLALSSLFSSIISMYISIKNIQMLIINVIFINFIYSTLLLIFSYLLIARYNLEGIGYAWLLASFLVSAFIVIVTIKYEKWLYK
jgi:O-antigen/teichoic acid export membrane protein